MARLQPIEEGRDGLWQQPIEEGRDGQAATNRGGKGWPGYNQQRREGMASGSNQKRREEMRGSNK